MNISPKIKGILEATAGMAAIPVLGALAQQLSTGHIDTSALVASVLFGVSVAITYLTGFLRALPIPPPSVLTDTPNTPVSDGVSTVSRP